MFLYVAPPLLSFGKNHLQVSENVSLVPSFPHLAFCRQTEYRYAHGLVTDKIYFKCHTLLLPCFIPYAMKDIANIDNPYTHTHLIVDDIYLNQLSQCHARHTMERYGPFPPGRTPISLFFISSCHHRPEEGMGKWGESKFRIDTKIAHFPCIMAKNSQTRSMTIAFMLILC